MTKNRRLKVYTKFRARAHDWTVIPTIRLEGKWLALLGFEQGKVVVIKQELNKLTITLDEAPT